MVKTALLDWSWTFVWLAPGESTAMLFAVAVLVWGALMTFTLVSARYGKNMTGLLKPGVGSRWGRGPGRCVFRMPGRVGRRCPARHTRRVPRATAGPWDRGRGTRGRWGGRRGCGWGGVPWAPLPRSVIGDG